MKRSLKTCVACGSAALLAIVACAPKEERAVSESPPPPPRAVLSVKDAWARAADSGAMSAVYFTLVNSAQVSDTLEGVSSAAAEEAGLHMSMQHGTTMHMAALQSLPVPAEDSVLFAPLAAHVMLTRLVRGVAVGDTLALQLTFASGQSLEVRADVRKP